MQDQLNKLSEENKSLKAELYDMSKQANGLRELIGAVIDRVGLEPAEATIEELFQRLDSLIEDQVQAEEPVDL